MSRKAKSIEAEYRAEVARGCLWERMGSDWKWTQEYFGGDGNILKIDSAIVAQFSK